MIHEYETLNNKAIDDFVNELAQFRMTDTEKEETTAYNGVTMLEGVESYRLKLRRLMLAFRNEIRTKDACFVHRLLVDIREIEQDILTASEDNLFDAVIGCLELELQQGNRNVKQGLEALKFFKQANATHKEFLRKTINHLEKVLSIFDKYEMQSTRKNRS